MRLSLPLLLGGTWLLVAAVVGSSSPALAAGNTYATFDQQYGGAALALDAIGNPVIALGFGDVGVIRCGNATCTGANIIAHIQTSANDGFFVSLALDAADNPVFSHRALENDDLVLTHCGNPTCMAGNTNVAADTAGIVGDWNSLALDQAGNPVVSYYDYTNGDLKVLHCGDPSCAAGNTVVVPDDTQGLEGAYTSLALDASGNPVVSYYAFIGELRVLHCGNPFCTSNNVIASPDTDGVVGSWTSLDLDANGNPVVSYYDSTAQSLNILRCGDPFCTSGNSIGSLVCCSANPIVSSLQLDGAGNPVVAYALDAQRPYVKVLHCVDATCTLKPTIASIETGGSPPYLALDSNGNPVVSYTSFSGVRVVHCGNSTCTAEIKSVGGLAAAPDVVAQDSQSSWLAALAIAALALLALTGVAARRRRI